MEEELNEFSGFEYFDLALVLSIRGPKMRTHMTNIFFRLKVNNAVVGRFHLCALETKQKTSPEKTWIFLKPHLTSAHVKSLNKLSISKNFLQTTV